MKVNIFNPPHFNSYPMWRDVSQEEWYDWRWQIRNQITEIGQIESSIDLTDSEQEGIRKLTGHFCVSITPYYFTLVDPHNPNCPIRMQVIPTLNELSVSPVDMADPLKEDRDRPVKHIVHRYPDRVLFYAGIAPDAGWLEQVTYILTGRILKTRLIICVSTKK